MLKVCPADSSERVRDLSVSAAKRASSPRERMPSFVHCYGYPMEARRRGRKRTMWRSSSCKPMPSVYPLRMAVSRAFGAMPSCIISIRGLRPTNCIAFCNRVALPLFCGTVGREPAAVLGAAASALSGQGVRTPDEQPLRLRHLRVLREVFPAPEVEGYQLLSMVRRVLRPGRIVAGLEWCDVRLLRLAPSLERFCRYVVLMLRKG